MDQLQYVLGHEQSRYFRRICDIYWLDLVFENRVGLTQMVADEHSPIGWIDHSFAQRVSRTVIKFNAPRWGLCVYFLEILNFFSFCFCSNGTIGDVDGDKRFTDSWYVVYNLFEVYNATTPAVTIFSAVRREERTGKRGSFFFPGGLSSKLFFQRTVPPQHYL